MTSRSDENVGPAMMSMSGNAGLGLFLFCPVGTKRGFHANMNLTVLTSLGTSKQRLQVTCKNKILFYTFGVLHLSSLSGIGCVL